MLHDVCDDMWVSLNCDGYENAIHVAVLSAVLKAQESQGCSHVHVSGSSLHV